MRGSHARLALCCAALQLGGCAPEPEVQPPNVVVVVIDTLRPDHLGFGGYPRETAPFLASLAAHGAVFERAYSTSSWTAPSTASIFTGLYPQRHGVVQGFFAHFHEAQGEDERGEAPSTLRLQRLPEERRTLPELFQAAGYTTLGLATNLNIGPEIGFDRGFDRFERLENVPAAELSRSLQPWEEVLQDPKSAPWFLYLHFNDVHTPYRPRKRWYVAEGDERARRVSAYDGEISYLDEQLAALFARLPIDDETLVVVVSDHGEEFQDHGNWFHGFSLHRELNQVLMLIHAPGLDVPARRVPVQVSLVDVLPTLAELAHLPAELEREATRNGRSLAPLLSSEPEAAYADFDPRPLFAHRELDEGEEVQHAWSVLRGRWKLYEIGGVRRLYDLWSDRAERHDLMEQEPEIAAELGALLDAEEARGIDQHSASSTVDLDEELFERLSSLGYVK